jgi:hypothetical protein
MSLSRRVVFGGIAAAAVMLSASFAWACIAPTSLLTSSSVVQPGGTLHIIGRETAPGAPIEIRLNAPDGRLLYTVTGQVGGMTAKWEADVPIPADVPYGKYVIYAVQNYRNMNSTIPKATIYVGTQPDAPAAPVVRPSTLSVGSGPSAGSIVLIALGVAAAGLLVVGGLSVLAGSRRSKPQAQPVKAS